MLLADVELKGPFRQRLTAGFGVEWWKGSRDRLGTRWKLFCLDDFEPSVKAVVAGAAGTPFCCGRCCYCPGSDLTSLFFIFKKKDWFYEKRC